MHTFRLKLTRSDIKKSTLTLSTLVVTLAWQLISNFCQFQPPLNQGRRLHRTYWFSTLRIFVTMEDGIDVIYCITSVNSSCIFFKSHVNNDFFFIVLPFSDWDFASCFSILIETYQIHLVYTSVKEFVPHIGTLRICLVLYPILYRNATRIVISEITPNITTWPTKEKD